MTPFATVEYIKSSLTGNELSALPSEKGMRVLKDKSFTIKRHFALLKVVIMRLHLLSLTFQLNGTKSEKWWNNPCGECRKLSFHLKKWVFAYWRRFMWVYINHFNCEILSTHTHTHGRILSSEEEMKKVGCWSCDKPTLHSTMQKRREINFARTFTRSWSDRHTQSSLMKNFSSFLRLKVF